jgi:hypothetical protein
MLTRFVIIIAFSGSLPPSLPIIRLTIVPERTRRETEKKKIIIVAF